MLDATDPTLGMWPFANMFAGHLLLVFILGGILSPFAFGFGIVLTFFELLVQVLQAYILTLLSALYIAGSAARGCRRRAIPHARPHPPRGGTRHAADPAGRPAP
jgi:hypothetical protein